MATVNCKLREPTKEEKDKIWEAAMNDNIHALQELTSNGVDVTGIVNTNKWTALHEAALEGSKNVITFLLSQGTGVNDVNNDQYTPLHFAASYGHTDSVAQLVDSGADINMKSLHNSTPLECAVINNRSATVHYFVRSLGMDITKIDEEMQQRANELLKQAEEELQEKRNQEIEETMLKARDAKYSVPIRYGKVLFCGAAAAGKSNFLNLLMKEDFQSLHISTEVLKPQQVTIAMKAVITSNDDEVEFKKMSIDEEILQLESYLPKEYIIPPALQNISLKAPAQEKPFADNLPKVYDTSVAPHLKRSLQAPKYPANNLPKKHTTSITTSQKHSSQTTLKDEHFAKHSKLALANVKTDTKRLNKKPPEAVWDMLTFMDTGGQPQFISMLPAVNSFAMITFIIHKMKTGGQNSLNRIVEVQYGDENGDISYKPHPHKYTYLQLIETLISYASNILLPDTTFLAKVKIDNKKFENTRSIVLAGTHSGDNQLSEDDIKKVDEELTKVVNISGVNHIKPSFNENYQFLMPVDNKKQGKSSEVETTKEKFELEITKENTKRPTKRFYKYMPKFLRNKNRMQEPINKEKQPQLPTITEGKKAHLSTIKDDTMRYTMPSKIRTYIKSFLDKQDKIHVPIKWLLLELEIRKVCQQKENCSLISYDDVLKLAKERKLGYNGEFGDDVSIDGEQFIKQGLRFHHAFGVLLYFEDVEGMQKLVITNHQWLFNKLSQIVEYSFTCETIEEMEDLKNGIFKKTLLSSDCLDISKDFKDSHLDVKSNDPINAFLKLLEYLRIAAPLTENAAKYFMPCLLDSCELTDLYNKVPEYKANDIEPLLIQFKSTDNKTYSFPRGAFCFLVVQLMLSMKWETYSQAYVNVITLLKKDSIHYVTLIDRIFCLEVHVTYKNNNNVHDEVRKIIDKALYAVSNKLKIDCNLCHGFTCPCQLIKEMHISYLTIDNDKLHCWCKKKSVTDLTDSHKLWLKTYFKKNSSVEEDYDTATSTAPEVLTQAPVSCSSNHQPVLRLYQSQPARIYQPQPAGLHQSLSVENRYSSVITDDGVKVTMTAREAIKRFNVELIQQLPLENDIFFIMTKQADLFPLDTGDSIAAKSTRAQKVSYFLQHVVEPGAEEYLPKLLNVMKESKIDNVVRLADEIQAATGIGKQVTMSAGDVIKQFTVELVRQLPLEDELFFAMAKHTDLFPLDTSDSIVAEPTRAKKVSYFLQHVVEPGAKEYLPKLLKVMKDSKVANVVRLANDIEAATDLVTTTNTVVTTTGSIDDNPGPLSRNISSPVLNEALQRISAEQIATSQDSLTKDELSTIIHKPQPKQNPVSNTETEQIRCSKSPDSTQDADSDMGKKSNSKNVLEKKLPFSHM